MESRGIYIGVIVFLAVLLVGAKEESPKIGYIDLQKVLMESKAGKKAREVLEGKQKESQKKLKELESSLAEMREELDKQKAILSPEAYQKKEEEFHKKREGFLQTYKTLELELQQQDARLTKDILDSLEPIIKKLGEERNYTMILEKTQSSILYAPESLELTSLVIDLYNRERGEEN